MKKSCLPAIAILSCALAAGCLLQIASLKQQVSNLQGDFSSQMSVINNRVSDLYSGITTELEEQASLLTGSAWEYGDADYEAKTVALNCTVTPKEYTAETTAVLVIDGAEHAMEQKNGAFTASAPIPLFGDSITPRVIFRDGGSFRTETLDWGISPHYDYLPFVYAQLNGGGTGSAENGVYTYAADGVIHVQADCKRDCAMTSVTLVELLDGRELGRTDIPLDSADFFENYQNENGARPEPAPTVQTPPTAGAAASAGPFYYALDKTYEIPFGSTLTLYVEAADENGLLYRCVVDRQEISDGGEPLDDGFGWMGMEANIYDADGNALYEPNPSLYQ